MYYSDLEKYLNKLTKKELIHLIYMCDMDDKINSKVKETREFQHKHDNKEVCWECRSIAVKLGLEK